MAKITAKRAQLKKANKGALAKASKALGPKTDKTGTAKLNKKIVPGTVLILLAGQHKGKRVIFLQQLKSGLLLVTGLVRVNGCPLRRVCQRFVLPTSMKVELPAAVVDAAKTADDAFFAKVKAHVVKQTQFVAKAPKENKRQTNKERVDLQHKIEAQLSPVVKAVGKEFVKYLGARFSLTTSMYPHKLKF
jgi:large subunit ribosomal protein L6e